MGKPSKNIIPFSLSRRQSAQRSPIRPTAEDGLEPRPSSRGQVGRPAGRGREVEARRSSPLLPPAPPGPGIRDRPTKRKLQQEGWGTKPRLCGPSSKISPTPREYNHHGNGKVVRQKKPSTTVTVSMGWWGVGPSRARPWGRHLHTHTHTVSLKPLSLSLCR